VRPRYQEPDPGVLVAIDLACSCVPIAYTSKGCWGCNIVLNPFKELYCALWARDEEGLRQGKLSDFGRNVLIIFQLFI
jgi:hypothetical protein